MTASWKRTRKGRENKMAVEYLGLSSINGPLVVLEGVQDAFMMKS